MNPWRRNLAFVVLGGLVAGSLVGCRAPSTRPSETIGARKPPLEVTERRADQPDEAEAYYAAKRQPLDPGVSVMQAYDIAQAHRRQMKQHSITLDQELSSINEQRSLGEKAQHLPIWEPLGPGNIGGRIRAFLIHPTNFNIMYAAGVSGGVWKTTNAGGSWSPTSDFLANIAVCSLVMDPTNPDVLFAGTGEGYMREEFRGIKMALRGAGIFTTPDGGATWSRLASTENDDFLWVNDIVISPTNHRRLYAATRTGVWRSENAGNSWNKVLNAPEHGGCLDLALRTDTTNDFLFAACGSWGQGRVYRNTAAESSGAWESVLSEALMGRVSLAIAPSDQRIIYGLAASVAPRADGTLSHELFGVFRSTSGGGSGTWAAQLRNTSTDQLSLQLLSNPVTAAYVECGWGTENVHIGQGWYDNIIAVDPLDPNIVWAGGVDLFRSNDGGKSWGVASYWWAEENQPSFVHADQHNIIFHPAYNGAGNQTLFVTNDGGIYRTDNARAAVAYGFSSLCNPVYSKVAFVSLNHSLGVTQFYHGAPFPDGKTYLGGTQDNGTLLGRDPNGAGAWSEIMGGDGGYVAVDPANPSIIYAESQFFGFSKSTNGGQSFKSARLGVSGDTFWFVTPFILDPNESTRLWAGGSRLWRSDNAAGSWTNASVPLDQDGLITTIAVAPKNSNLVLAGTSSGKIFRSETGLTANGATRWDQALPREGWVSWLAFDPLDPQVVWATYAGFGGAHVYRSGDGGRTWAVNTAVGAAALPDVPVHCIVVDPEHSSRLFVGTDIGVFVSQDGGDSWAVENTGFATAVTENLANTRRADGSNLLFAFTHGRGAWRVNLPQAEPTPIPRHPRRHLGRT